MHARNSAARLSGTRLSALCAAAALAVWAIAPAQAAGGVGPDIYGGNVAPAGSWPSTASFEYLNVRIPELAHACGATLISPRDIMTAAHCVDGVESKYHHKILLGTQHLQRMGEPMQGKFYNVAWTIQHPRFGDTRYPFGDYDIAILRLAEPVRDITPMRLVADAAEEARLAPPGATAWVAGWGAISNKKEVSADLLQLSVPIMSNEACANISDLYGEGITPNMLCAGGNLGQGSCNGDSGGPLIVRTGPNNEAVQIGLVSYGVKYECGTAGDPSIYTRISAVRDWIQQQIDRP